MKHIRDVLENSSLIRVSLLLFAMFAGLDALAWLTVGQFTPVGTWWGLIVLLLTYVAYRSGATWARNPVVTTRGRAPEESTSFARVRSRTETVPMPPNIAALLEKDLASASTQNRHTRLILALFCALLGVAAALFLHTPLPLMTALVAGALYIAMLSAALPWLTQDLRRDVLARTVQRTSGPVKVDWSHTRHGFVWTLRIGDQELSIWDARVGQRLANMPWGTATYTHSRRLLDLRDLDDDVIFSHPTRPVPEYWTGMLLWFVPLALLVPIIFVWVAITAFATQVLAR